MKDVSFDPELSQGARNAVRTCLRIEPTEKVTLITDEATRDRTIGALAELGDPRAVHPLAELASFAEWEQLPKIIDAVSKIGGDEATAYLELVASGHQSPIIRDMAKKALEHMKATPAAPR